VFDEIFRYHLRNVYELYDEEVPSSLERPMMKARGTSTAYSTMHGSG
jgi:hypothetical protein